MALHTPDLPATPVRDRTIEATTWSEAPAGLLALGDDIGRPPVVYRRRIHRFLLWRAGPPSRGDTRYMALDADDLAVAYTFRLHPDGNGRGIGADGREHTRLRTWKESLRDP
jgi:hypothetical protein